MNADDRHSFLDGFSIVGINARADTGGYGRAARSYFIPIRYFHRNLDRVGKHLRPNRAT